MPRVVSAGAPPALTWPAWKPSQAVASSRAAASTEATDGGKQGMDDLLRCRGRRSAWGSSLPAQVHCLIASRSGLGRSPAPAGARRRRGRCRNRRTCCLARTAKPLFSTDGVALPGARFGELGHPGRRVALGRKRSAQNGASATTVALCAATPASLRAVGACHPAAPGETRGRRRRRRRSTAPWINGLVSLGIFMANPLRPHCGRSRRRTQDRVAGNQQNQEDREQDGRYEPVSHALPPLGGSARISQPSQAEALWAMVNTLVHAS
jgi:hypothetical protein